MTYTSVADILAANEQIRRRLTTRLESLSETQRTARPAAGGWSVAEIVEHLSITEQRLGQLLQMMLEKAAESGAAAQSPPQFTPFSLDEFAERARGQKFEAPEFIRPSGGVALPDSLASLSESRAAVEALRPRLEATDLSAAQYPHPAFGPLNIAQYLAFIGLHEERHLRQIERLVETLDAEG